GQTTPGQTVPGQTIPGQTAPGQTIPGQTAPGQTVPGQPVPGQPTAAGMVDPSTYVPRTEHDNTPWRFNMTQGGKNMTAEEFDQWLKQRGVRVATGKPTKPL